jgi:branched-chain amino acid transport system ATP-binding protein
VILSVRGLRVSFGSVVALDGVDVDVDEGERLALIGPNGSGKTTLFNAVSGVVRPKAGRVEFLGHDITRWSLERTARAGLVRTFQHDAVFPGLTVAENVALPLSLRHTRGDVSLPASLDQLLEIAGLGGLDEEPAATLSYGNRRRLGVAIAVALNPVLVMLDEPAAGLNEHETHALLTMLVELNRLGVTLVVIEHDMPFISSLCSRAVVLNTGTVIARGTPQEVRRDPAVISAYLGGHVAAAV